MADIESAPFLETATLDGTEIVGLVQAGTAKNATTQAIANLAPNPIIAACRVDDEQGILSGKNVASITKNGTGDYTVNLTTNDATGWVPLVTHLDGNGGNIICGIAGDVLHWSVTGTQVPASDFAFSFVLVSTD